MSQAPIIVLHETVSSLADTISALANPSSTVAYHVIIGQDGSVTYLVDPIYAVAASYPSAFQGYSVNNSVDDFAYQIALETPPDGRDPTQATHSGYSQEQYLSLGWLTTQTAIPLANIVTHQSVDTSGTSMDPRSFDSTQLTSNYNAYSSQSQTIYLGL